jgi:predicted XRE-type DNA-binding protein
LLDFPSQVAAALGVSQARISQIEHGDLDAMELDTLRATLRRSADMSRSRSASANMP